MTSESLATMSDVTKRFDKTSPPAIDHLSFKVQGAQVTGLVGPDGAGKTTLLRLLAGLLLPTEGTINVCGYDTAGDVAPIRQCVSYMPQRFGLYEDLTVQENLDLYADLRGLAGRERRERFDRLMQFTNLGRFTDRLAGKLSGGMKQKLGLACALIVTPKLLLLDEPSVGVDPISRRELWQMVYELVDEGIGVVWSTAYLDEAERCKTVLTINEGRPLYLGPPKDLTRRVEGRTFLIPNLGPERRQILAAALKRPEVIDGVIQGSSVRLVFAEARDARDAKIDVGGSSLKPTPPRFEDAFVDLLAQQQNAKQRAATIKERSEAGTSSGPLTLGRGSDQTKEGEHDDAPVVEARELTKQFGNFVAADHVTFRIERGEIFGLLGPNGAGKSTIFKMMCGLLRPTFGTARVVGYDLYRAGGKARTRLGYMAQKFSLYGDLSVQENLDFFAGVYGLSGARRQQATARMIEMFNLQAYANTNSGSMPLGFKQRLALASAIMHEPPVLFLDEPTSGVDPLTRREFWSHINAMVERGVTIMVTTHFLDEAEYCDRVGLVYAGHVIAEGSPDELKDLVKNKERPEPTLEDAFIELVEHYDTEHEAA